MSKLNPELLQKLKQIKQIETVFERANHYKNPRNEKGWLVFFALCLTGGGMYTAFYIFEAQGKGAVFSILMPVALLGLYSLILLLLRKDHKTWDDELLWRLTKYIPVDTDAYARLQREAAKTKVLDWKSVQVFIICEKEAIYPPNLLSPSMSRFVGRKL